MIDRIRRAGQVSWALVGLVAVVVLIGYVGWYIRVVFPPLLLAGAIVFILNPVVTWIQRRHIPRALGTAFAYLGCIGLVTLSGVLVAPLFSTQVDELTERWPELEADLQDWVDDLARRSEQSDWPFRIPTWDAIQNELGDNVASENLGEQIDRAREIGVAVFHVVIVIILAPIIAFYFLVDLPHLRRVAESLVPEQSKAEVFVVARRLNRAIGGFFRGQLAVAFIVGTMVSIALLVLGLPLWLLVGMVAGLFNMIPLIGPWVGAIPGILIALATRDVGTAVWVAVIMASVQQIDNHFITPNVMQRAVKLHPAAVMLALLAGGTIGGFFGLLLAVPVAAVAKILLSHFWHTYVLGEPIEELAAEWAKEDTQPPERRQAVTAERAAVEAEVDEAEAVGEGETPPGPAAEPADVP
ncbi:MAG: AI-2E family transporter [Acidimicrobiales bacterium]